MTDKTTPAEGLISDVLHQMKMAKSSLVGTGPGPDPDTISYLSLGWTNADDANSARDKKVRLVAELRNGKPVIVVQKV